MEFEILEGPKKGGQTGGIMGKGGCGKSTATTYARNPFYLATEEKTLQLARKGFTLRGFKDVPKTADELFAMLKFFNDNIEKIGADNLVLDNITEIQPMFNAKVIKDNPVILRKDPNNPTKKIEVKVKSIMDYDFGFGLENTVVLWDRLWAAFRAINKKGVNVIWVGHTHEKSKEDEVTGESYKAVELRLPSWGGVNIPAMFEEKSHWLYYMTSEASTTKVRGKFGGEKVIARTGMSDVTVHTRKTTRYFAKIATAEPELIPDFYSYGESDASEVCTKIFNDLEK